MVGKVSLYVPVGGGAIHCIPRSGVDPHIVWTLTHGEPNNLVAAAIIQSFDYLLSRAIPMKEAVRRLSILRAAKRLESKPKERAT